MPEKRDPPANTGQKSDTTSNGQLPPGFEPGPAPPESSNRDHPSKVGKRVAVPGAGVERSGARADVVGDPDRSYKEGKDPRVQKPTTLPPVHREQRERRDGIGSAESSSANGSVAPLSPPTGDEDPGPHDPANTVPGINDPNFTAATYPEGERREKRGPNE